MEIRDAVDRGSSVTGEVARARRNCVALFVLDGAGFGIWAALLPSLQVRLGLDEAGLGLAMLGMVGGAFVAMLGMGRLVARWGSRCLLRGIVPLYGIALCGPAFAPSLDWLLALAAVFGFLKGSLDVCVNVQALVVEEKVGKPVMSSFQACWSLGGLLSAALVGLALGSGLSGAAICLLASIGLLGAGIFFAGGLLPEGERKMEQGESSGGVVWSMLPIGLLAFAGLMAEGVLMDWSALYVSQVGGAADWAAPLAYGSFCLAMATGRFLGDGLQLRWGEVNLLRWSGGFAFVGMLLQVFAKGWEPIFAGLVLAGLGLSNLVPIFMRAAAKNHPEGAARGVAAVSSIGYVGFLAGPPLVGWLAHGYGLPTAFASVTVLTFFIAIKGPSLAYGRSRAGCRGSAWRQQSEY